ncbi:hypothetical protein EV421DRAFT_1789306, partial [Armillaria borealis]
MMTFIALCIWVTLTFFTAEIAFSETYILKCRIALSTLLECGHDVLGIFARLLRGFYFDIPLPSSLSPWIDKHPELLSFKSYLDLPIPAHWKAITRLLMFSHILTVEVLRWRERYRKFVPR